MNRRFSYYYINQDKTLLTRVVSCGPSRWGNPAEGYTEYGVNIWTLVDGRFGSFVKADNVREKHFTDLIEVKIETFQVLFGGRQCS